MSITKYKIMLVHVKLIQAQQLLILREIITILDITQY